MSEPDAMFSDTRPAPTTSTRMASGLVGLGGVTVLGLARWLTPAVEGHSTHTQLGLDPCSFLAWTGFPCPMCGATTTFALMADLRVVEAFATQPFAALLFGLTVVVSGVALAEALLPTGRWERISARVSPWEGHLAAGFLVAMIAGWIYKIAVMA